MTDATDRRLTASAKLPLHRVILNNFVGGISWGVGSVIGATVVISIIVRLLQRVDFVPMIGDFVSQVIEQISANNPLL